MGEESGDVFFTKGIMGILQGFLGQISHNIWLPSKTLQFGGNHNKGFEGEGREDFGLPPLQFFKPCKGRGSFSLPFPSLPSNQTSSKGMFGCQESDGRKGKVKVN